MRVIGEYANLCYFNYQYSGEQVGRAMVGLEFQTVADRDACRKLAEQMQGTTIQSIHEMPDDAPPRACLHVSHTVGNCLMAYVDSGITIP